MTSSLRPPGGVYWRGAIFAPVTIDMPIQIGMESSEWPNPDLNIDMPIHIGMGTPMVFGLSMNLFIAMLGKPSGAAAFNISMPVQVGMSPFTPFAVTLTLAVVMTAHPVHFGNQLNTTIQRAATI